MSTYPTVGRLRPHRNGVGMAIGFLQFNAPCGCHGLAQVVGDTLHVLAIAARAPGRGQFREFVRSAKRNYRAVVVWEVWSDVVDKSLARYGFSADMLATFDGREVLPVMRWERQPDAGATPEQRGRPDGLG